MKIPNLLRRLDSDEGEFQVGVVNSIIVNVNSFELFNRSVS